jgi:hypothetical protein
MKSAMESSVLGERGSHHESRLSARLKPPEPVSAQSVLTITTSDLLTSGAERRIYGCVVPGGWARQGLNL